MALTTFLASALLLAGAGSCVAEVLEENALDGCGTGHRAFHDAAYGWLYTSCRSENNGACFVTAHEERYRALVKACDESRTNQSARIRQNRAESPNYSSDVIIAISQLNATLATHHGRLESIVQDHHGVLVNTTEYAQQLVCDIVLASLEANRTDVALRHYGALLEPETKQLVQESYHQEHGDGRKVALLLQFVRALPDAEERTAVYRQLEELLQTNHQDERYPGILFTEDASRYGNGSKPYKPNPERYPKRALARWQRQLLGGFFTEAVQFAGDHPDYYERIEPELVRSVTERWSAEAWPTVVRYPNALPRPEQRVRAFRLLLEALAPHAKEMNDRHLMQLGGEMSRLERGLTGQQEQQEEIKELRKKFPQFTYDRSFLTYTELFALYKPAVV
uniref:Putative secreted protein n=1 Tax=Anopheles nuneztovari TaxID=30067 RepID=A0A2M3YW61_9DIPT